MEREQFTKFSPYMCEIKQRLRGLRLEAGLTVYKGAKALSVSRKQLEDLETLRNYGAHVDVETLGRACQFYGVPMGNFAPSHLVNKKEYFVRPRGRGAQR